MLLLHHSQETRGMDEYMIPRPSAVINLRKFRSMARCCNYKQQNFCIAWFLYRLVSLVLLIVDSIWCWRAPFQYQMNRKREIDDQFGLGCIEILEIHPLVIRIPRWTQFNAAFAKLINFLFTQFLKYMHSLTKVNAQDEISHGKPPGLCASFSLHNFGRFFSFLYQSIHNHQTFNRSILRYDPKFTYGVNSDMNWPAFHKHLYFDTHVKSV